MWSASGSVLGPLLFLIYVNDIAAHIPRDKVFMFADDTTLFFKNKDTNALEMEAFESSNVVTQYFSSNNLKINEDKTSYMWIQTRQRSKVNERTAMSLLINDKPIIEEDNVQFLGVRLDNRLSWNPHIETLEAKLSSAIFTLRQISRYQNLELNVMTYRALFESHVRYSVVLWGSSSALNLGKIFILQKRAVRVIKGLSFAAHCKEHFKALNIMTVPGLYIFETIIYVIKNGLQFINNRHTYNTRDRNYYSERHKLKMSENKPVYMGNKFFCALPDYLKVTPMPDFERKLKKYIISECVYSLGDFLG